MTNWSQLTVACQEGMKLAAENPGRYGGRYVARRYNKKKKQTEFIVLADDDPDKYANDEDLDILAQCVPNKVHAIGGARSYLESDGTVNFGS